MPGLVSRLWQNVRAAFRGQVLAQATESVGEDPWWAAGMTFMPPSYQAQAILRLAGLGVPIMGRRRRGEDRIERWTREKLVPVARDLEAWNPYVIGLLTTLDTFVLGKGYTYDVCIKTDTRVPEELRDLVPKWERAAQGYLDNWRCRERWHEREGELYRRSKVDGEVLIRYFVQESQDGSGRRVVTVRPMEPEYVRPPEGGEEWLDGVLVDMDDVEVPLAYWFWDGQREGEEIDASEVYHIKSNVPRCVRRGTSDFAQAAEIMAEAHKLVRNTIKAASYRESIIYYTKHAEADDADIDQYVKGVADYRAGRFTNSNQSESNVLVRDGVGIEHITNNQDITSAPRPDTTSGSIDSLNTALLAVARRYGFPLWLISGDTSANTVSTSLAAESPMGRSVEREQTTYGEHLRGMLWKVMEIAAQDGIAPIPPEALRYLDLKVTPHSAVPRNRKDETERRVILVDKGLLDKDEAIREEGYDPAKVRQNIARERAQEQAQVHANLNQTSGQGGNDGEPAVPSGRTPYDAGRTVQR